MTEPDHNPVFDTIDDTPTTQDPLPPPEELVTVTFRTTADTKTKLFELAHEDYTSTSALIVHVLGWYLSFRAIGGSSVGPPSLPPRTIGRAK